MPRLSTSSPIPSPFGTCLTDEAEVRPRLSTASRSRSGIRSDITDESLLRAVSLAIMLQGFGTHFRGSSLASGSGQLSMDEADELHALSHRVDSIDYFLSHSWQDSRQEKWLTLCLHFNLFRAMLVSSLVVATVKTLVAVAALPTATLILCGEREVHYGPWCCVAGSLSFLLCIHFGHLLGRQKVTVFLDKLCVHQADAQRKRAGILSFAAFVARSRRVLCVWSPVYFTRLWCTLEMAALASRSAQAALPLVFLPLKLYKFGYWLCVVTICARIGHAINNLTGRVIPSEGLIMGLFGIAGALALSHAMRQYLRDRRELEKQLRTFSVEEAACVSEDDRALIHRALVDWFGELTEFNTLVQTQVRAHIVAAIGTSLHVPIFLNGPVMLLQVFYEIDYAMSGCYGLNAGEFNTFGLLRTLAWIFCMGSILPVLLRIASCFWLLPERRTANWAATLLLALMGGAVFAGEAFLIFGLIGDSAPGRPPWPMALIALLSALRFLWLQKESFGHRPARASEPAAI